MKGHGSLGELMPVVSELTLRQSRPEAFAASRNRRLAKYFGPL
jgi:hypothetical protein